MKRKTPLTTVETAYICHFQPEPEGGYTATCSALPPVVSYGEMFEEARASVREAIALCLEVLRDEGQPIPPADRDPRKAVEELVPVTLPA